MWGNYYAKSIVFLSAYAKHFENIMRENILFIEPTKETKLLGINLARIARDLQEQNFNTFLGVREENSKWKESSFCRIALLFFPSLPTSCFPSPSPPRAPPPPFLTGELCYYIEVRCVWEWSEDIISRNMAKMLYFKCRCPLLSTFYLTEERMVRWPLLFRFIHSVRIPRGGGWVLAALHPKFRAGRIVPRGGLTVELV